MSQPTLALLLLAHVASALTLVSVEAATLQGISAGVCSVRCGA
jgi:hypothetical protein